jgi:ATP-dependent exoDNAse (exonuclease V) beta subunit
MNCEKMPFEYDTKLSKYRLGNVEQGEKSENIAEKIEEKTNYSERVKELKNMSVFVPKREIYNPSQFFKHNDRDRMFETANINITKGLAVHKLLEILPSAPKENRNGIADIYLKNVFTTLDTESKNEVKEQIIKILDNEEYSQFFGSNSRAETAVVGEVDGMNISGQIDRLADLGDRIVILEYKNTRKNYGSRDELPASYLKQLELYGKLVQKYYGDKAVEGYILLTGFLRLVRVV